MLLNTGGSGKGYQCQGHCFDCIKPHTFAVEPGMVTDTPNQHKKRIADPKKLGCDAIVMASHGRRRVSAIVLGSETVKVLTYSAVPVVVVRGQHPGAFFVAS